MGDQIYPALLDDPQRLLCAMKFLRSAQTYDCPALRLRIAAENIARLYFLSSSHHTPLPCVCAQHG